MPADEPVLALDGRRYVEALGIDLNIATDVVVVYDESLVGRRSVRDRLPGARAQGSHPFRRVVRLADDIDLVLAVGPGAAVASVTVEVLAALGVRRIVSVGSGAGVGSVAEGATCVVDEAPDPDGLMPTPYGEPAPRSGPLFDALHAAVAARVQAHTTPWPFRVPASVVRNGNEASATVVEMESRALFAVGDHEAIDTQALVVISDIHQPGDWVLAHPAAVAAGLRLALDVATAALVATRSEPGVAS